MKKYVLWIGGGLLLVAVAGVAIYMLFGQKGSVSQSPEVWNQRMVVGAEDAPNQLIEYSDYFCEYCSDFHEQTSSKEFQDKYLESGKVRLETRIVTVLSEGSPNTEAGAEAAFCAADQDKFTEYSNDIIPRIKHDFFDKGIGVSSAVDYQPIEPQAPSYFEESANSVGLDLKSFRGCMEGHVHRDEITKNTNRAIELGVKGLPSVVVNDRMVKGFSDGWQGFELMLKAGGVEVD